MRLYKRRFASYLMSLPEGAIVGHSGDACDCPVTRWVEFITGSLAFTGNKTVTIHPIGPGKPSGVVVIESKWIPKFVVKVDKFGGNDSMPITREDALAILETL